MKSILIISLALLCTSVACAQNTTIILVRHAEKSNDHTHNPSLSEEGENRASELCRVLKHVAIDEIYSTDYARTQQTVRPVAGMSATEIQIYNPADLQGFAHLLKSKAGKTIVVAGHSNTTPILVNLLSGSNLDNIEEHDYDNLYIVTCNAEKCDALTLEYGTKSP